MFNRDDRIQRRKNDQDLPSRSSHRFKKETTYTLVYNTTERALMTNHDEVVRVGLRKRDMNICKLCTVLSLSRYQHSADDGNHRMSKTSKQKPLLDCGQSAITNRGWMPFFFFFCFAFLSFFLPLKIKRFRFHHHQGRSSNN